MMMMSQVARALDAGLHGDDVLITGVSKDTRDIHTGDLYVALKGERFDGHEFVKQASDAGAAGMLVSDLQPLAVPQVQVADTRLALGQLAAYWRGHWGETQAAGMLIGITGSNGKTSVKEMCSKVLSDFAGADAVLSTRGNLNNDIGMPMTLLELREQHQFAVIEMGANHVAEIDYLTSIARPDVAIVNNVGPAHLEGFGSLEKTAQAKAEIYNGLSEDGVAVINRDDVFSDYWMEYCAAVKRLSFSMQDKTADLYAEKIDDDRYLVRLDTDQSAPEQAELRLQVPGKHNVMNALAATAAVYSAGIPLQFIMDSLSAFENIQGRLTSRRSYIGCQVIDDTYNANPLSVAAAIDVLAGIVAPVRVLVLGDMAELGSDAARLHAEIGVKASQAGIDYLYATGDLSVNTTQAFGENGFHFADKDTLIEALNEKLTGSEAVLVKGSRSASMEEVVERILTHQNNNKRVN